MSRELNRRQAMAAIGTVSLGALLAGCGDDDEAAVTPSTESVDRFEDSASCKLTTELTEAPTTSTPTPSAATSARTARASRCGSASVCARPDHASRSPMRSWTSGTALYPGWYQGRAVHIHVKVHLDRRTLLTTQLFFDDALSRRVYRSRPYSARGQMDVSNDADAIFDESLVLTIRKAGGGYAGAMTFDVERA